MIAETGAGQHGVASATAAALFGLECTVYMGEVDTKRQELNVFRMELLGAEVRPVTLGQPHAEGRRQRGDARVGRHGRDDALLHRVGHGAPSVPVHGAPVPAGGRRGGARPVPRAARRLRTPTSSSRASAAVRTPRGPSPASSTRRRGWSASRRPAARRSTNGIPGVLHGMHSRLLQDEAGQIEEAESISAGLDYPGPRSRARVPRRDRPGRVHAWPTTTRCSRRSGCSSHTEGIIPALESAHAVAWVARSAGTDELPAGSTVLITLSGRGDKDVAQVREIFGRTSDA